MTDIDIATEITVSNGKTHNKWAMFYSYVKLPKANDVYNSP